MRILSGIQPSGSFHVGNYFAMIRKMIDYQTAHELFLFIANLHALTTLYDSATMARNTIEAAASLLALGIDPEKAVFWVQSDVPEVTELTWILSNVTPVGLLERCHSYKDKIAKGIAPNHGLFSYPVLMAADILLFRTHRVPVGRDQKQHLEVARDIAAKFNATFGKTFVIPEAEIDDEVAVVPGTDGQKMSKSYGNTIDIFGDKSLLQRQVMSIVTDPTPIEAPKNPDRCTLFAIASLFLDATEREELRTRYLRGGLKYSDVKHDLVEMIWNYFEPCREQYQSLLANPTVVIETLATGAQKARAIASEVMIEVREKVGLAYGRR